GDEFGELARSFDRMTAALKESRGQVQQALSDRDRRLQEALAELRQTQQRAIEDERLRAMGQMASGIAHDCNNALAPILGFTELLLRRFDQLDDKAEIRSHLELIHTAAQDAANVIGRLSEFYGSRNDGERQEAIDLNAVVEQAIALTQPRWKDQALARGVTIAVHADLQPVPALTGSDAELREALTNLIFNAVDAMPTGGTLTLRTRAEDACVAVEVGDTGTGMPEEVRRRCLEPFFSTKGDRGTGLGLAIVHGIVQRHDGTLDIESALDVGTTMRLLLPITGARAEGRRPEAGRLARSLRVLVVDDEPRICELLTAYLASDGHRVEAATCGREALDKFRAGRFDAVLTDRGMPEMNGDHLATAIKELSPSTPVVLVTGFGDMMKAAGEWPDGIDAIVSKPFTLAALRHTLAQLAGPAPRGSAADV
ncbi:MAG: response regulator, partial [Chloroflexi bacterium]|nr:response regulator [Chloroflexota bacterium]